MESMETDLLALRSAPDDVETLNAIFRSAHSIKGSAGSFGLTKLVRFTHALENLLDRLRSLEMPATAEVISLLLRCVDVLRAMLDPGADGGMPVAPELVEQIEKLDRARGAVFGRGHRGGGEHEEGNSRSACGRRPRPGPGTEFLSG